MQELNFRPYPLRLKNRQNKLLIFDVIRKKFVRLLPEEWVRQHCIHYLLEDRNYSPGLLSVETQITVNGLPRRADIVLYRPDGSIFLLVECKAPNVSLDQSVFDQIFRYNRESKAAYLMVTNGLTHYFAKINAEADGFELLEALPPLH